MNDYHRETSFVRTTVRTSGVSDTTPGSPRLSPTCRTISLRLPTRTRHTQENTKDGGGPSEGTNKDGDNYTHEETVEVRVSYSKDEHTKRTVGTSTVWSGSDVS